jgi:hypothetical protein
LGYLNTHGLDLVFVHQHLLLYNNLKYYPHLFVHLDQLYSPKNIRIKTKCCYTFLPKIPALRDMKPIKLYSNFHLHLHHNPWCTRILRNWNISYCNTIWGICNSVKTNCYISPRISRFAPLLHCDSMTIIRYIELRPIGKLELAPQLKRTCTNWNLIYIIED